MHTPVFEYHEPERAIKLKARSYTTTLGCYVDAQWFTSMRGEVTEVVCLYTPTGREVQYRSPKK